ncbi:protein phosphatase PP2A regulatory subunit A, putative [Plasmodium knowlesi strain H]|uniref:Protein phosphatase PP2A regulatory subunit A, putative n=3 Tax=Plasmodium knowlesi TaxID=5850 RepID=A0A5K1VQI8_PLAKH|nr:protein phosphatase PP2A regulatory subunit A, putative [Plasmodium knowlesi strain H]OTN64166.1 putative Protein phosphatase PP2A regulatory subunit A [Plasmodium knowlesi]CAA9990805.1 protein phosphatase PP2A regulatory subunit A, putative [Plasmodium knowlesi strain H]SBO21037.1 protein phosphatase PP2A regulatory subunit A, putative [Plasmodium knowlesi strain H]SBO21526.1 protein phosphatase PP2A regulatory subunit A, putative [Plasmodium knowlesi strain H]VVS80279.1 protein phosphatas|eukprot:XP_002262093.1 hypothetical protein, conserved in Plasmodium species [Plasmodium knowlesi strain H]
MERRKAQEIIDGIQASDPKTRLKHMKEIKTLCEILGMERTKNEVIEFLYNIVEDDSDVLFELSNNLVTITNFLNDVNNCSSLCDLILHFIVTYEKEINVNAFFAFNNYLQKCNCSTLLNIICPKIVNVASSDSDNYRIGVSKILPIIIERCIKEGQPKYMKTFIQMFLELCQDQSILVRKSCCETFCSFIFILKKYKELSQNCTYLSAKGEEEKGKALPEDETVGRAQEYALQIGVNNEADWKGGTVNADRKGQIDGKRLNGEEVNNVVSTHRILESGTSGNTPNGDEKKERKNVQEEIIALKTNEKRKIFVEKLWEGAKEIYRSFFSPINGMDEVQISAVSILADILTCDPHFVKNLEETLRNICNDESWRVRAVLANNIHRILKVRKSDDISIVILLLLKDVDSNVRSIVLNNLDNILVHSKISVNIMDEIFDDLKRDIDSNNVHLKISLCKLLCSLPDILDKNGSIEYILPLFLLFIRIEESDLKSDLFTCLHKISKLISFFDMKQIIMPLCQEIVKSKNWRLRCTLYHYLKFFDHFFFYQNKENFSSNYGDFWNFINIGAKDMVYSIRMEVVNTLHFLIKAKSFSFFEKGITYLLSDLKESSRHICRITCLQYISRLVVYFPLHYIENKVLSILEDLNNDKISNVRYNIVKTIYYVKNYVKYVLSVIMSDTYNTLMDKITKMVERRNRENEESEKVSSGEGIQVPTSNAKLNINLHSTLGANVDVETDDNSEHDMQNFMSKKPSGNGTGYFHLLENKQCLLKDQIKRKKYSFLINSCAVSSLTFYDNMKNTETNKLCCERILSFLSEKINSLGADKDADVSTASKSLKNDDFFYYVSSVNTFSAVCKPIK